MLECLVGHVVYLIRAEKGSHDGVTTHSRNFTVLKTRKVKIERRHSWRHKINQDKIRKKTFFRCIGLQLERSWNDRSCGCKSRFCGIFRAKYSSSVATETGKTLQQVHGQYRYFDWCVSESTRGFVPSQTTTVLAASLFSNWCLMTSIFCLIVLRYNFSVALTF